MKGNHCEVLPPRLLSLKEVTMFVRNKSHVNDTTAFIALMSEKAVTINHTSDGSWFIYPGNRQAEGTYAFCGGEEDYEPLLSMLRLCGKEVTVNEQ